MKPRTLWCLLGLFLLALSSYFLVDQSLIFRLVENYLSPDDSLSTNGRKIVTQSVYVFCAWGFVFSALAFKLMRKSTRDILYSRIFLDNVDGRIVTQPRLIIVLYISVYVPVFVLGVLHYYGPQEFPILFAEDGVFETSTALIFLISAAVFFFAAFKSHTAMVDPLSRAKHLLLPLNVANGLLLFGVGMEEIDWGQRIFDIKTPAYFAEENYQAVLNIHNFFNPHKVLINRLVSSLMVLTLLLGWFRKTSNPSWFFDCFFPHGSLIFLCFMLILVGNILENEMLEELVAVFVIFYSYRTYKLYRTV